MLPYANYLKYLLSTGRDEKDIIADMAELGFSPTREQLDSIRNTMMLPPVFKEYARGGQVDEKFIIKYASRFNIKEMWRYRLRNKPPEVKEMLQLVEDRQARLVPVILAIKGYPRYDTALQELGREYSAQSVQLLLHYFFNTKTVNLAGWRDFFQTFAPEARALLDQPLDYILFKLGLNPALTFSSILTDLMHMGYYKAKDFLSVDTRDHINMGKTMAELAIKAGEKLHKYGKGETNSFLEDIVLEFERANIPIPSVIEMKEGEESEPLTLI
jgi:hypothetical protein